MERRFYQSHVSEVRVQILWRWGGRQWFALKRILCVFVSVWLTLRVVLGLWTRLCLFQTCWKKVIFFIIANCCSCNVGVRGCLWRVVLEGSWGFVLGVSFRFGRNSLCNMKIGKHKNWNWKWGPLRWVWPPQNTWLIDCKTHKFVTGKLN